MNTTAKTEGKVTVRATLRNRAGRDCDLGELTDKPSVKVRLWNLGQTYFAKGQNFRGDLIHRLINLIP